MKEVETAMSLDERLIALAKVRSTVGPVISVYLNTRWSDEQQRERVRVFLKKKVRDARKAEGAEAFAEDLDWIEAQGEALIRQARFPEASGVALFACRSLALREVLPVRVPFDDVFVVDDSPYLRPLAERAEEALPALVAFVDGESARLIALDPERVGEELTLTSEVEGRHRRGGWAALAQSRYQRHIEEHRGKHFDAVAAAVTELAERHGVSRIVLAGHPRTLTTFRKHLPNRIVSYVTGNISGTRYEPAQELVDRAAELLTRADVQEESTEAAARLTEAAKGGHAAAGVERTLEAVNRGAVHRLYILRGFSQRGCECTACAALQTGTDEVCRFCGRPTRPVELGEEIVTRVIATGGSVDALAGHDDLQRAGGMLAVLRYPVSPSRPDRGA